MSVDIGRLSTLHSWDPCTWEAIGVNLANFRVSRTAVGSVKLFSALPKKVCLGSRVIFS